MTENRIVVRWNPNDPTTIQEKAFLDRSISAAQRAGIRIVFSVYATEAGGSRRIPTRGSPSSPPTCKSSPAPIRRCRASSSATSRTRPTSGSRRVGSDGAQLSAVLYERLLAASYDALKAVSGSITVVGAGPSGDANDITSISPVRFVKALGDAYRASGREARLMDQLAFHVYPRANTDAPSRPRDWPNVGPVDLDRLKQAIWDAFAGTVQPPFPEGPAAPGGLTLMVDEFGWQAAVDPAHAAAYYGAENVATVSEDEQAQIYASLVADLECDLLSRTRWRSTSWTRRTSTRSRAGSCAPTAHSDRLRGDAHGYRRVGRMRLAAPLVARHWGDRGGRHVPVGKGPGETGRLRLLGDGLGRRAGQSGDLPRVGRPQVRKA